MALKTILLHLDHQDCSPRTDIAVSLAKAHGARLIGLFAELSKAHTVGSVATWPPESYKEAAATARAAFDAKTAGLDKVEWRDANRGGAGEIIQVLTEAAHNADLVILGKDQGAGATHSSVPAGMAEQVILQSGRPALVVPNAGHFTSLGTRPVIAWNNKREAARALKDAVPLMAGATEALVVTFVDRADATAESAEECVRYLADHGISARIECLVVEGIGIMDMLLSRAGDTGADLLVMGAHSHYGFPFAIRGNGTRHVLSETFIPVLMSN